MTTTSWTRWGPAALVALGAAAATAHGLHEVAIASRVPDPLAISYPLITDGLALVAYSATRRLKGAAARYGWTVVVLAAGLSGLAQAVYLAADAVVADPALRFGVGAWPAVAAGLAAHLLHLLLTAEEKPTTRAAGTSVSHGATSPRPLPIRPAQQPKAPELPAAEPPACNAPAPDEQGSEPATADVDPRVVDLARRLARGEELAGPAVAAEYGLADRSGRRLLNDARTHLEQHQPLHLVTRKDTTA